MLSLIYGGAACGKSAFAEALALREDGPHLYLATMQPAGKDSLRRIERHRRMRRGRGFETVEWYTDIGSFSPPSDATVLLECLGNLLANEMFLPEGAGEDALEAVCGGLDRLMERCRHLVVVSNDVGRDGFAYAAETLRYIQWLGAINRHLAARADRVVELVCGLPVWMRGEA